MGGGDMIQSKYITDEAQIMQYLSKIVTQKTKIINIPTLKNLYVHDKDTHLYYKIDNLESTKDLKHNKTNDYITTYIITGRYTDAESQKYIKITFGQSTGVNVPVVAEGSTSPATFSEPYTSYFEIYTSSDDKNYVTSENIELAIDDISNTYLQYKG